MIKVLFVIFMGGGFGSVARYGVQMLMHERIVAYNFPWATFAVNIAGSFLIGLFYALSARLNLSDEVRLFLTVGLCGGFTTFSTFSNDILAMMRGGEGFTAILYVAASIFLGVMACMAGAALMPR